MERITHVDIRMYKIGTGDCFVLKFFSTDQRVFSMMIDGGAIFGAKPKLVKFAKDIVKYLEGELDLLVITHEHLDHVLLFEKCLDEIKDGLNIDRIWMAWTEDDDDEKVKRWKVEHGKKKRALAMASQKIRKSLKNRKFVNETKLSFKGDDKLQSYKDFADVLEEFGQLHFAVNNVNDYIGGLKGMENVKREIADDNISYLKQGEILDLEGIEKVNVYVLGPPNSIEEVHKEKGTKGTEEAYDHNKVLAKSDSFAMSFSGLNNGDENPNPIFDSKYERKENDIKKYYQSSNGEWRKIDLDWILSGAANLALRLNEGINNLSLVLAIEFVDTGQVMLFPGDAEIGSWLSWHNINWKQSGIDNEKFTEDLLNRVEFYKVAHHLSHNGTAKEKGLKMMNSKNLVSMATLDFDVIRPNWKSTMPNRAILKDLIERTKGRFIVLNDKDLFFDFQEKMPLKDRIEKETKKLSKKELEKFKNNYKQEELFHEYRFEVK